ncbi:hypothetical protein A0H76_224 [Hepatospora eriocheir]|uniref:Uncharacterized protein n=1 Tax=Hepatospora eriocheir TaxID=1081669 RepID=A0A1X0QES3_9MICR|nr:hypothetical protein A0H76_224 [Hepatospora eriocheir]
MLNKNMKSDFDNSEDKDDIKDSLTNDNNSRTNEMSFMKNYGLNFETPEYLDYYEKLTPEQRAFKSNLKAAYEARIYNNYDNVLCNGCSTKINFKSRNESKLGSSCNDEPEYELLAYDRIIFCWSCHKAFIRNKKYCPICYRVPRKTEINNDKHCLMCKHSFSTFE